MKNRQKIVFLDIMFDHPERLAMGSKPNKKTTKEFYFKIIQLLKYLSKAYRKKVVICLHPKDNLFKKKKIFKNFEVVKYSSQKNIFIGPKGRISKNCTKNGKPYFTHTHTKRFYFQGINY